MATNDFQNITIQGLYDDNTGNPLFGVLGQSAYSSGSPASASGVIMAGVDENGNLQAISVNTLGIVNVNATFAPGSVFGVTQSTSPWIVAGNKTNNTAAPNGANIGVLTALANAAPPTDVEGNLVLLSVDLAGNLRTLANQGTTPWVTNVTQWNSVALGSPTAFGVAPSGNVIGTNSSLFAGSIPLSATLFGSPAVEALNVYVVNQSSMATSVTGTLTNNNAAPTNNNLGVLGFVATSTPEAYTNGDQVLATTTLGGSVRVIPADEANAASINYFTYDSGAVYKTLGAGATYLFSIQANSTTVIFLLRELQWMTDGSVVFFQLYKNSVLVGAAFTALAGTHIKVDTAATGGFTTGTPVFSGYAGTGARAYDELLQAMASGAPGDTFTTVATKLGTGTSKALAQISWSEQAAAI